NPGIPLRNLPGDVSMRLAIRRSSRVGRNAGQPVEDLGVNVGERYITNIVEDVLQGYPGIIREAAKILATRMRLFRVDVARVKRHGDGVSLDVRSTNVTSLRFFL